MGTTTFVFPNSFHTTFDSAKLVLQSYKRLKNVSLTFNALSTEQALALCAALAYDNKAFDTLNITLTHFDLDSEFEFQMIEKLVSGLIENVTSQHLSLDIGGHLFTAGSDWKQKLSEDTHIIPSLPSSYHDEHSLSGESPSPAPQEVLEFHAAIHQLTDSPQSEVFTFDTLIQALQLPHMNECTTIELKFDTLKDGQGALLAASLKQINAMQSLRIEAPCGDRETIIELMQGLIGCDLAMLNLDIYGFEFKKDNAGPLTQKHIQTFADQFREHHNQQELRELEQKVASLALSFKKDLSELGGMVVTQASDMLRGASSYLPSFNVSMPSLPFNACMQTQPLESSSPKGEPPESKKMK